MPAKAKVVPNATIQFLDVTQKVRVRYATIPPGASVPKYRVSQGYVVFAYAKSVARLVKTTYRGNTVVKVERLRLDPKKPFYVEAFKPGLTVSMKNVGKGIVVFGKLPAHKPPPPRHGPPPSQKKL
jgi:hypothetical protein